jgi:hypothetical protein
LHPGSFSSSKSKLIFSKYILNFPFNPSSKYLCYYLCCMCKNKLYGLYWYYSLRVTYYASFRSYSLMMAIDRM